MSQTKLYQNIIHSVVTSQKINVSIKEDLEASIIKSIEKSHYIRPGTYKRKFNLSIKDFVQIMNELTKEGILSLRFEIALGHETSHEKFKLGDLPNYYYDNELDQNVAVDINKNVRPVYEVTDFE
ncbi:hypothetical protein V8V48_05385 [Staphylococcus xylosus]|uniref:hypothetical protein n=1 Tax=Staphylococcus xylosus TaxID=1288 RepID=UPI003200B94E